MLTRGVGAVTTSAAAAAVEFRTVEYVEKRVTHIMCIGCVCATTMLWIMGNVVKADQFESVIIFTNLCYEYGLVLARAYLL